MPGHRSHHAIETALHRGGVLARLVLQHVRSFVDPVVGTLDVGPKLAGLLQTSLDQAAQFIELRRALFF
jgi:hypothetical protein